MGAPILALTLLLHAAFAVTYFAKRTAKETPNAEPVVSLVNESPPASAIATRPSQRETSHIEIPDPPHELVVLELPPPQGPVEQAPPPVAQSAPVAEAPNLVEPVVEDDAPKACEKPSGMFGTNLTFAANPMEARKQAATKEKLVFLLHVSGDFDDPGFT